MLDRKRLGRTGLQVSQLGYGSMGLRGPQTWGVRVVSEEAAERCLHAVLDAGINFIDTAPDYGISEERIGRYLAARRDEYYLATKCGCAPVQHADHLEIRHIWRPDVIERNVADSLTRMQTDRLDVLQFHGGTATQLQAAGLIERALAFRDEGVVRFLGVSSKLPELPDLLALDVFDVIQLPYSCLVPEHHDWITTAAERDVGVIVRGGIAHGGPGAAIQRPALDQIWQQAGLEELLPAGMSSAELILRFTLTHPHCHTVIVGTCNHQHLADNVAAARAGPLPEELYREIRRRVAAITA